MIKIINEGTSYKRIARYGEFDNDKPHIKESKIQESGFKTVFYYNDKKISAAKAKEIAGPDRLKRLVADAKEQYSEDPYVQNSYMVSGGMLTIEFV